MKFIFSKQLIISVILWPLFGFFSEVFSQEVPSQMMIGDVKLIINESARKQIQKDVDRLTRSDTYYNILVDRMNLYFPYIEREHKKAGIPDEIKFLSIQESALISDAVSTANAVGFWQFKDFTGREVGLRVDRKVDERLNIVSASRGSGKYFNNNNRSFDSWPYAVIAYQAGATGAKAHTDSKQYGSKRLNITPKSYWYLKKFIAHVVAFSPAVGRPHSENIYLDEITNAGGKTLAQIARSEKVELEELEKYNKWLKNGEVPKDKTYSILVPREGKDPKRKEKREKVREEEPPLTRITEPVAKVYPSELAPGITDADRPTIITLNNIPSILAKGYDDVFTLATRATLSEDRFRKYNDLSPNDQVIPGEFYYIKKKKNRSKIGYHIAQYNENLWSVSQQYGIKLSKLAKKNRMTIADKLKAGRVLWLKKTRPKDTEIVYHEIKEPVIIKPTPPEVTQIDIDPIEEDFTVDEGKDTEVIIEEEEEEIEPIVVPVVDSSAENKKVKIHTVAAGESLWSIAKKYELKMDDLLRWNELENPDQISIGQNIQVKAPIEEAAADKQFATHTVQPGETMYALSRKYGMTLDELMDLNNMSTPDLSVGDELKVYKE